MTGRATDWFAWLGLVLPGVALMAITLWGPLSDISWFAPETAFWSVLAITALCVVGAGLVTTLGWRRRLAEVSILGSVLMAVSILPLAHALTIPGVLYGPNSSTVVAVILAVPTAAITALPLIAPGSGVGRVIGMRWRLWTLVTMSASIALAALLVVAPNVFAAPEVGQPVALALVAISFAGMLPLSLRHLRLYRIGRRRGSLAASAAFSYLGLSTLVFVVGEPFSIGWWAAHLADAIGVFGGIFGLAIAHYRDRSLARTLAPVTNRDPVLALELGLTPIVGRFIAALERKDTSTRDHVVRVGELSMRAGVRAGLGSSGLRAVGLAALLHDIGKVFTPDEVLRKAGRLSSAEYDVIKRHPVAGYELLAGSPMLAEAAELVRWHHERPDGSGYPDGLAGEQIPNGARLISVADGWDAMTWNRHYRPALNDDVARQILREGAGSQWDERAVGIVLEELDESGPVLVGSFEGVGRRKLNGISAEAAPAAICTDALPEHVRARFRARQTTLRDGGGSGEEVAGLRGARE